MSIAAIHKPHSQDSLEHIPEIANNFWNPRLLSCSLAAACLYGLRVPIYQRLRSSHVVSE